ncbi:hypothetical protein FOZ62_006412, partial [Perkinsus olseni]
GILDELFSLEVDGTVAQNIDTKDKIIPLARDPNTEGPVTRSQVKREPATTTARTILPFLVTTWRLVVESWLICGTPIMEDGPLRVDVSGSGYLSQPSLFLGELRFRSHMPKKGGKGKKGKKKADAPIGVPIPPPALFEYLQREYESMEKELLNKSVEADEISKRTREDRLAMKEM